VGRSYWWHVAKRALVTDLLRRHFPTPARLVETYRPQRVNGTMDEPGRQLNLRFSLLQSHNWYIMEIGGKNYSKWPGQSA
jgi:hypothetical protein